jgi:Zn-dependent M28 family amino/carboxypeptidase
LFSTIDYTKDKSPHKISSLFFIIFLLFVILTSAISKRILYNTPELTETPFLGGEAWKDLKYLNDIGPKVTGTSANEVIALSYIKNRILKIISKANKAQNVEFDHQIVTGSYFLAFKPYGMGAAYRSVQNLVVKVNGNESNNALLLNCHFDSVPGSPGANDDLANCAIMLEILSIISQKEEQNRHPIIFLFNGAEEAILKASHGFITQHKWAKDVKVLINLEAAGTGGKEALFQSGPGNSWLLNHYHTVKNPFAQTAAEEIFQSNMIPSDTDFRVFRDYGNVVGMDFAHVAKGYRYHTKFDHIDYLTIGVIQRTGENILNLAQSIANGFELNDPAKVNLIKKQQLVTTFLCFF